MCVEKIISLFGCTIEWQTGEETEFKFILFITLFYLIEIASAPTIIRRQKYRRLLIEVWRACCTYSANSEQNYVYKTMVLATAVTVIVGKQSKKE